MKTLSSNIIRAILLTFPILPLIFFITNYIFSNNSSKNYVTIKYQTKTPKDITFQSWEGFMNHKNFNTITNFSNNYYYSKIEVTPKELNKALLISNSNANSNIDIFSIQFSNNNNSRTYSNKDLKNILITTTNNTLIYSLNNYFGIKNNILPSEAVTRTNLHHYFYNNLYLQKILCICLIVSLVIFIILLLLIKKYTRFRSINIKHLLFISFFSIIISTPLLVNANISNNSNTKETITKPDLAENDIFNYMRKYSKYFANSFGFKNDLTAIDGYIKNKILKKSSVPDIVSIGNNNWLFYTKYLNDTSTFNKNQLKTIKHNLEYHQKKLASLGIKFYFFCPPTKDKVYNELTPNNFIKKNNIRKIDQIKSYLKENSNITIIDPLYDLLNAKNDNIIYYPNDTHWNFYGGIIGLNTLLTEINKTFPTITPYNISLLKNEEVYSHGDLGNMLNEKSFFYCKSIKPIVEFNTNTNSDTSIICKYRKPDNLMLIKTITPNISAPNILFVRDSYSIAYIPFVINKFQNSFFLWSKNHSFDYDIIEKEKPDIVVLEILEFYLDDLLLDPEKL